MKRFTLAFALSCLPLIPSECIVISEIMYHPQGDNEAPHEWVELYNDYLVPLDIGGWSFSKGIQFEFPRGTVMEGKSYVVVCADVAAMQSMYNIAPGKLMGPFEGRLANGGEQTALADKMGAVMARVRYTDRYPWPAGPDGTGHSLALINTDLANDDPRNWAVSPQRLGSPGDPNGFEASTIITDNFLVKEGEEWKYFKGMDQPSDPVNAWTKPEFDDSGWLSGPTGIGYDDNDDATVLDDMQGRYVSVFCRKRFEVTDVSSIDTLILKVVYDDGFIAYLNGEEVGRRNMGNPGDVFAFNRPSSGGVGDLPESADISVARSFLREGRNVLAIQVHNSAVSSSDLSLIPSLLSRRVKVIGGVTPMPVVINELLANSTDDTFVELFNNSNAQVDIGLAYLSDDPDDPFKYRIPVGAFIGSWGYLAFTGTEIGFQLPQADGVLYFTSSGGERIIDACAYGTALPGMSWGRCPDGEGPWYAMENTSAGKPNEVSVNTSIVMNEIMYHTYENNSNEEYIELYNRGSEPVDLSGWRFSDGVDFVFPMGTTLGPDQYLVVAKSMKTLYKKYRIDNVIGDFQGNLENEGERIQLVDALGNLVDEVRYADGGRWPIWAAGWGSSLELIDPRQDNSVPSAWAASDERNRAEWAYFQYSGQFSGGESEFHFFLMHRGECLIDDISMTRGGEEYIPNGSFESGTSGWKIEGNHIQSTIYTQEAHSGSRCLKIVSTGRGDTGANRIECDTARFLTGGQPYTVSFWVKWQRGINLIYTRTHNQGVAKATRFPMPGRRGTPGTRNTVYSPNIGPVISEVIQKPIVPKPGDAAMVTARISDADGVSSVTLYYKGDYDGSYSSTQMYDDGLHGDRRAGDGLYAGEIPPRGSSDLMRFYVVARDTLSASQRFPAEDAKFCLYQIEDSPPSTKLPVYRILLTRETDQRLGSCNRLSNEHEDCSFVLNDSEIFYNCGIRTRGSGWTRRNHPSDQYRIRFNADQPLRGVWKEINLDWHEDNTKQKDRTVHHLLRQLGRVPTSYQRYVHVRFNGNFAALAEEAQKVDGDYVRFYWPDDAAGTLFKVDDHFEYDDGMGHTYEDAYLKWLGPNSNWDEAIEKEKYRWNWKLRTNEKEDDYSDFLNLVYLMDPQTTADSGFEYSAERVLDVDEWLRVLSVRFLVDDWDTFGYDRGKNAYIYRPYHKGDGTPVDPPRYGKWVLLPWDSDLTFTNSNAPIVATKFPSIQRMLETPRFQRWYYSHYLKLIDGPFSRQEIDPVLDRVYRALSGEQGAPSGPGGIKSFVSSRISFIRSMIPKAEFAITTNGGEDLETEEARLTLEGTAPVTVRMMSLKVNDGPHSVFEPAWSDATHWQTAFSLVPGINLLQITARDLEGNEVGTVSIMVNRRLSATQDSDKDGLYDREEAEVYHTHYLKPDTDGDGLTDGDEVHVYSTNPTEMDTDGDGMGDGDEVLAGTAPNDRTSLLTVVEVANNGSVVSFSWASVPGRQYAVHQSADLTEWKVVEVVGADGNITTFVSSDGFAGSARLYYKVQVLPPP